MNSCWMIEAMETVSVAIVYVHVANSKPYAELTKRFTDTYSKFPPEYPHRSIIVCNNGSPGSHEPLFDRLPQRQFLHHDNTGKDIGAYQKAAREVPCELMVFFGGSTYFRRAGWLKRMVEAYKKHGPTLYGSTANRGAPQIHVYPHIRTTAFWMPPALFNQYPERVTRDDQRYPFEHGRTCLTDWVSRNGMVPLVVSFEGEYPWEQWDSIPGGYHNGNQEQLLVGDRLCEKPYWHTP